MILLDAIHATEEPQLYWIHERVLFLEIPRLDGLDLEHLDSGPRGLMPCLAEAHSFHSLSRPDRFSPVKPRHPFKPETVSAYGPRSPTSPMSPHRATRRR